jgi:peptide deformylase
MALLSLILAPDPIFNKTSSLVEVNNETTKLMDDLLETMYYERGIGIAAPMAGKSHRVIVIDLQENGLKNPIFMANPEVIEKSGEIQVFEEGSLCFPGISAPITRASKITVKYLDYNGNEQILKAEGFLSSCVQHEIDYLNGIVFLKYLSPVKRDMLMRKMEKFKKLKLQHAHHEHTEFCNH